LVWIFWVSIVDTGVPGIDRLVLAVSLGKWGLLLVDTPSLLLVPLISLAL
jgi:hypothetical protein